MSLPGEHSSLPENHSAEKPGASAETNGRGGELHSDGRNADAHSALQLSSQTRFNILVISVVGVVSILLLLFGTFEGKVTRVISTVILFALFTFLSSNDAKRLKTEGLVRLAQVGNIYSLVLALFLIWGSLAVYAAEDAALVFLTVILVGLVKVGVLAVEKLVPLIHQPQRQLSLAAYLTAAGFAALTVLYSLPMGLYRMATFSDFYWRFSVAVVLFTALALSVSLIILWAGKKDAPAPVLLAPATPTVPGEERRPPQHPMNPAPAQSAAAPISQQAPARQSAPAVVAPQFSAPVPASLPWPVFPDGRPLPAKPNGRPDFNALSSVAAQYVRAEQQFFGS